MHIIYMTSPSPCHLSDRYDAHNLYNIASQSSSSPSFHCDKYIFLVICMTCIRYKASLPSLHSHLSFL